MGTFLFSTWPDEEHPGLSKYIAYVVAHDFPRDWCPGRQASKVVMEPGARWWLQLVSYERAEFPPFFRRAAYLALPTAFSVIRSRVCTIALENLSHAAAPPQEGSRNNLIEHNVCEEQKDDDSGCMGLRGDDNTVRWNDISDCEGAGVRIGGEDGYGEGNNIYGNTIRDCEYAAFKVPIVIAVCALSPSPAPGPCPFVVCAPRGFLLASPM